MDTQKVTLNELNIDDRRNWSRFPGNGDSVTIRYQAGEQTATVVNKSFGGIALSVSDASAVTPGEQVAVLYEEIECQAVVKRVKPHADGHTVIALEWKGQPSFLRKILDVVLRYASPSSSD